MIRPLFRSKEGRRFLVIAVFLLLLAPVTLLVRDAHVARIGDHSAREQAQRAGEALTYAEQDFRRIEEQALALARRLAEDGQVIRAMRELHRTGAPLVPDELVRRVAEVELGERSGVEVYDLSPRVVAWKGVDMPMDTAPASDRFLTTFQTAIASDADRRQALVAWWPVLDGTQPVGAVRVIHIIERRVPVQNQYIRDYDLADEWQRAVRLPVRLSTGLESDVTRGGRSRLLQGSDGSLLGRVIVEPPTTEEIVQDVALRYRHVVAFWLTILLVWLGLGLWSWHRHRLARVEDDESLLPSAARLLLVIGWIVFVRFALLWLDVPARWQRGKAPLAPLFDPAHLASSFGGGLLRSSGDYLLSTIVLVLIAAATVHFCLRTRPVSAFMVRRLETASSSFRFHGLLAFGFIAALVLALQLRHLTHHIILDSTLDFFSRAALIPSPLEMLVLGSLLLAVVAAVLFAVAAFWPATSAIVVRSISGRKVGRRVVAWQLGFTALLLIAAAAGIMSYEGAVAAALLAATAIGGGLLATREQQVDLLYLRSILPALFLVTVTVYPLLYEGMTIQRRHQMLDTADTFSEGRDPRVMFALEQAMRQTVSHPDVERFLAEEADPANRRRLDSIASSVVQTSLIGSLAGYEVSLTLVDADGRPRGRFVEVDQAAGRLMLDELDAGEFEILRQMYRESAAAGAMVEQVTGRRDPGRLQYEGIMPLHPGPDAAAGGWVMARAEPRALLQEFIAPFPRVLLPASTYEAMYAGMSIAEFRDGVIVRNVGREFGRYRLAEDVWQSLQRQPEQWRREVINRQPYRTYYRRQHLSADLYTGRETTSVTAVRMPAINIFDHLFYLLRVMMAGMLIGIPLYLGGLVFRHRRGWLPSQRVLFRDRVLNSFLAVGVVAVVAVGFVGLRLVRSENERSIRSWLQQHLERVEETLVLEAGVDEMPYRVLSRVNVDSLAARVGLDLNVYVGPYLVSSSRPQMIRERLIESRLPPDAFLALFYEGFRFTSTEERVGSFSYTAGFKALPDEQGRPRFIISVPTLPEQERIEEERARTVAYLFGALLLLVLVVIITASILANALARPVARLREGLESVARGRFQRPLPVDSRDEIGELVETFNDMQRQLAESRRKLAQQERQLAWREMARQVAHEIRNPLTPMKLSVQHLRRAYDADAGAERTAEDGCFHRLFERITATLIEQIDALARIATEFHSFARLPSRVLERVDLNLVADEAIALMQEEAAADIRFEPDPRPLMIDADREELRRVFINLIKNADQAIPDGRAGMITVITTIDADADGTEWVQAAVMDNGAGIPPELHERIFEPNFSTKTSGTGLGLAIIRKSIEEVQGKVWFETKPDEGTSFFIRLPLKERP